MARSKYINTFDTTAEYNNYIESALPAFPNVGYDKEAGEVIIRRSSPNDYQIWGTTTATENFNIKLNNKNVEVTVDPILGEFYLTGFTENLTSLERCFSENNTITSIKKFALDTSNVTTIKYMLHNCHSLKSVNLSGMNTEKVTNMSGLFYSYPFPPLNYIDLTGWNLSSSNINVEQCMYGNPRGTNASIYITEEATLNLLTNNLQNASDGGTWSQCIGRDATIYYNDIIYKWNKNAWTPQS